MDLSSLRHQKSSKGFVFTPVWNKNSFVILEICLPDWKDFSCACCLWSYVSQRNYNIALMLSWSLLFWTAKHKSIHVALFPAGSESWALLSALNRVLCEEQEGDGFLVGTSGTCSMQGAVFTLALAVVLNSCGNRRWCFRCFLNPLFLELGHLNLACVTKQFIMIMNVLVAFGKYTRNTAKNAVQVGWKL